MHDMILLLQSLLIDVVKWTGMNPLELPAAAFGLACVWLTVRQNIWCWPTGLIQVLLYIVVFYHVKLYSDAILQVIYVILCLQGWYQWLHGGKDRGTLTVTALNGLGTAGWVIVAAVTTAAWGWMMASFTDAAIPYGDAFVVMASLAAQWLMNRKKLQSWFFWIAADIAAIGVYFRKDLYPTSLLYAVFLGLAIAGYFTWRRAMKGPVATGEAR